MEFMIHDMHQKDDDWHNYVLSCEIEGCTDPNAENYDAATVDDTRASIASQDAQTQTLRTTVPQPLWTWLVYRGCTDPSAVNFNGLATLTMARAIMALQGALIQPRTTTRQLQWTITRAGLKVPVAEISVRMEKQCRVRIIHVFVKKDLRRYMRKRHHTQTCGKCYEIVGKSYSNRRGYYRETKDN